MTTSDASASTVSSLAGARVLLVSSSYPFHRRDFHALFVHQMATGMVARGAAVEVVTPQTPEGGAAFERWEGVSVERFSYPGLGRFALTGGEGMVENARAAPHKALSAPGLMAAFVTATRRAARRFRPDLVITHWIVPSGLAVSLARVRCPVVHVAHSSDVHLLARLPLGRAVGRVIRASGPVLATSDALAERMRTAGIVDDPLPWRLPVDVPPARSTGSLARAPLRVVAMSRLIEGKGLETLLSAVARVPGVELRIAGAGPVSSSLAEAIARVGLGDRVSLVGPVLGDDKRALLESADVFAFVPTPRPGSFEDNLPVSVLEAMAHGVPVVATRVGHLGALLEGGRGGVLVEPDAASVADALERLAGNDRAELSRRARQTAEEFSMERSLQALWSMVPDQPAP